MLVVISEGDITDGDGLVVGRMHVPGLLGHEIHGGAISQELPGPSGGQSDEPRQLRPPPTPARKLALRIY